jgi:hypothetical protein
MPYNQLAPVVLFVYNRPEHTKKCLESLANNKLAMHSTLYIFCDGAKENALEHDLKNIIEVEQVVRERQWCKEVIIQKQDKNIGLRNSVINGVSEVINNHNKVIVIEDDLVLSHHFLAYMNSALVKFEGDETVSQISGFSFNLNVAKLKDDAYFLPLTTTWGWATWKRIWNNVDFEGKDYEKILSNKAAIRKFNLDNSYDYYSMLLKQLERNKKISSWGIMFWLHSFKNDYKILFPKYTLVTNTGFDGTGTHKGKTKIDLVFSFENEVTKYSQNSTIDEVLFLQLKNKLRKQEYSFKNKLIRLYNKIAGK